MKFLLIVLFIVILAGLILRYIRSQGAVSGPPSAKVAEIPSIVSTLERNGFGGSFVVFLFTLPGNNDEMMPNIQYSIENGRVGLDWVLEAPQNIKDQIPLADFIKRNGYIALRNDGEDVPYLRVEGKGVGDLGVKILREFYHLSPDATLELISEGVMRD